MSAHKAFDDSDVQPLPAIPRTKSSEDIAAEEHPLLEARHVDALTHSVRAMTTVLTRVEAVHREQLDVMRFISRSQEGLREDIASLRDAILGRRLPDDDHDPT